MAIPILHKGKQYHEHDPKMSIIRDKYMTDERILHK